MRTYSHVPFLLALTALLLGYGRSSAESLEQVTEEALRNNPELQVFAQEVRAAKGHVRTARTYSNPELSVSPGFRRTRESDARKDEFHGELSLSQVFQFPGKRALETAVAQRNVELAEIALEGFRFQLATKVRRVFYEVLAAQEIAESRQQQVESASLFVESAKKRAEAGYASDFETVKSQADLIAGKRAFREAEAEMTNARVTLTTLMGHSPASPLIPTGNLKTISVPRRQVNFVALAMERNPAIRTQARQVEIAGLNVQATRLSRRPDLIIGPSVEYLENEQTYGLGVTLPLPLWDHKQGAIETAAAEQKKALAELEKTRVEIAGEVTKASMNFESARSQVALYSPAFLEQLKSLMGHAEQSYAQSATTLLMYLDAKRTYFDTLVDYYESLSRLAASRADLEAAVGVSLDPRQ